MRVLFTTLRNTSHFLPLVPFLEACRGGGHAVAVAAPPDLEERVAQTGAAFLPFGHPGDEGLRPIWARLAAGLPDEEAKRVVIEEIFAGANARAALPGLTQTVKEWQPDVVVRESQEYAGVVAAETAGVPHARVAITLQRGEAETFRLAAPPVDLLRASVGLPPDPSGEHLQREPALTQMPASLEFPDGEPAAHVRRFRALNREAAPLPAWWDGQDGPLLYVTLGTVAGGMERSRAAYRVAIEAVSGLPIRVLFTTGAELPHDALGEVPANVRVERFVPQGDVLPHARAILCHGGSGTVLGALAAGVPLVVTPLFADQPHNAERVAATGAGIALDGRSLSAPELRRALTRVLDEDSFRLAAQRFAAEIAALPSMEEAPAEIERIASRKSAT